MAAGVLAGSFFAKIPERLPALLPFPAVVLREYQRGITL